MIAVVRSLGFNQDVRHRRGRRRRRHRGCLGPGDAASLMDHDQPQRSTGGQAAIVRTHSDVGNYSMKRVAVAATVMVDSL